MNHIKFAGLVSNWDYNYAKSYADKLFEMGFYSKPIVVNEKAIVAYSHRPFSKEEYKKEYDDLSINEKEDTPSM